MADPPFLAETLALGADAAALEVQRWPTMDNEVVAKLSMKPTTTALDGSPPCSASTSGPQPDHCKDLRGKTSPDSCVSTGAAFKPGSASNRRRISQAA